MFWLLGGIGVAALFLKGVNVLSYRVLARRVLAQRTWDLNICAGKTDGGGVNADIVQHAELPRFVHIADIYNLPFKNKQFEYVLCSHTLEHVDNPELFYQELRRVGKHVTVLVPPLWDLAATFNFFEHKWIFLSVRTTSTQLPKHVRLLGARTLHARTSQLIRA